MQKTLNNFLSNKNTTKNLKQKIKLPKLQHHYTEFEEDSFITKERIEKSLKSFWDEQMINKGKDDYFSILFKVYVNNFDGFKSITVKFRINVDNYDECLEYCYESWNIKSEEYRSSLCSAICFTYREIPKILNKKSSRFPKIKGVDKKNEFRLGGYDLPTTMDISRWGTCTWLSKTEAIINKPLGKLTYHVKLKEEINEVSVKINDTVLVNFTDYRLKSDNSSELFKRVVKEQTYIFKDGKIKLKTIKRRLRKITTIAKEDILKENYITMDLETRKIDGVLSPYCVSLYDGDIKKSFFLTDYPSSEEMLKDSILYLMKRKYDKYKVYLHNFSNFDSIFMVNILQKLSHEGLKPNRRNGKLIDVKFTYDKYSVHFRDSYLLLPASLKKLGECFNVEHKKSYFPHKFLDDIRVKLNYIGKLPGIDKFYEIDHDEYLNLQSEYRNNWNLKEQAIKYCELDVISLYQVIDAFSKWIFKTFRVNVHKYPTLPSLAFAIFRSNFLKDMNIPIVSGTMYNFFQEGYTGGSVDVYKPFAENVYRYDVNSLYPFVMKNFPMPVGDPTYFEGDISKFNSYYNSNERPFGVFEVEVIAPKYIKIPLLQKRYKVNGATSTISPLGRWTGVYFSEELYNAEKHGYSFTIKRGFLFDEKAYIFSDYVDTLYSIKEQSTKNSADYIISKMLLNSLYGRLGMNPEMERHKIVDDVEAFELENSDEVIITDLTPLENEKVWLSYIKDNSKSDTSSDFVNISVPIALAITAYARMHMSQFKTMSDVEIAYSDTDSIDLNKRLDSKYVGNALGLMKLEAIFDEAVYVAPKVYGGVMSEKLSNGETKVSELVKTKGFKEKLSYAELKSLLYKDSVLKLNQDKWKRNYTNSEIEIKKEVYSLMVTSNKRKLIYNKKGVLVDTQAIELNENND